MRTWFHYFSRHQKSNMNCFQCDLTQSYGDAVYIKVTLLTSLL